MTKDCGAKAPIKVFIADDQHLVRGALAALLSLQGDLEVVGEAADGAQIVSQVRQCRPDVLIMDIEMPGTSGLEATKELRDAGLLGAGKAHVLIVTTFGRTGYLQRALAAGASGFIMKDAPPDSLADAVRRIHAGHRVIDPGLAERALFSPPNPLTQREVEVCHAATEHHSVRDIAAALHLSEGTVRNHLSAIMTKTATGNRHAAVAAAEDNGWL
ncbi:MULTISPECIES: response regulator [unclassified Corynebacterium]